MKKLAGFLCLTMILGGVVVNARMQKPTQAQLDAFDKQMKAANEAVAARATAERKLADQVAQTKVTMGDKPKSKAPASASAQSASVIGKVSKSAVMNMIKVAQIAAAVLASADNAAAAAFDGAANFCPWDPRRQAALHQQANQLRRAGRDASSAANQLKQLADLAATFQVGQHVRREIPGVIYLDVIIVA